MAELRVGCKMPWKGCTTWCSFHLSPLTLRHKTARLQTYDHSLLQPRAGLHRVMIWFGTVSVRGLSKGRGRVRIGLYCKDRV